ncbi:MAG: glycosyltransferase family 4 protein [Caulobacteraceae bacterium]|nr:glycosyltransferase family 4 protein [Caulobacteraceae bacterium]
MRILIFATHHGDYSIELGATLARRSRVTVLMDEGQAKNDCGPEQIEAFSKVGSFRIFSSRTILRLKSTLTVLGAVLTLRPDLVIAHAHYGPFTLFLQKLLSRFCPIYLIVHDPAPHTGRDAEVSSKSARLDRQGRELASVFLVHGAFCAGQLRDTGVVGDRSIVSVPHGPILRPETRTAPVDPPFVLMFGRMEAYKGLDVLLAACQRLAARGTPIRCKLMGRGAELERLKTAFEAAGAEVVCAFIPRNAAIQALREASAVVAPYTEATQSGVVAAAFAAGRPIVASAIGGLVDFIQDGENGLLVPANDPDALADALHRITTDPALWRRLAAGAQATATGAISWERFAEAIYATAAARSGRA